MLSKTAGWNCHRLCPSARRPGVQALTLNVNLLGHL